MEKTDQISNFKDDLHKLRGDFEAIWITFIHDMNNSKLDKNLYTQIYIVDNPTDQEILKKISLVRGPEYRVMSYESVPEKLREILLNKHGDRSALPHMDGGNNSNVHITNGCELKKTEFVRGGGMKTIEKMKVLQVVLDDNAHPDVLGKLLDKTQIFR